MTITPWIVAPLGSAFSGAKLFHYAPGTSNLKNVYPTEADADAATNPLAQPVELDSVGWAQVWLDGRYKLVLKSADEATTYFTIDGVGDATGENALPLGYITGLEVTVNATDSDHDIDVSAGEARDVADTADIVLTGNGLTKRLDATWAAGTGNGGMESGATLAANNDYYVYGIVGLGNGLSDVLVSASSSAPTMPSGYDARRLLAKVRTDNAANIASVIGMGGRLLPSPLDAGLGWEFVKSITGGGASYDFTDGVTPDCDAYAVVLADLRPTDATGPNLLLRLRNATLAAFQSGAADYEYHGQTLGADVNTYDGLGSVGDSSIRLTVNVGDASNEGVSGIIELFNLAADVANNRVFARLGWQTNAATAVLRGSNVVGHYNGAQNPIDGIRLLFSVGNIASGRASLYRLRRR